MGRKKIRNSQNQIHWEVAPSAFNGLPQLDSKFEKCLNLNSRDLAFSL